LYLSDSFFFISCVVFFVRWSPQENQPCLLCSLVAARKPALSDADKDTKNVFGHFVAADSVANWLEAERILKRIHN
jgi:hypothetical protein